MLVLTSCTSHRSPISSSFDLQNLKLACQLGYILAIKDSYPAVDAEAAKNAPGTCDIAIDEAFKTK